MACILREKPDVVCTDVRMPDIMGIDLIEKCRSACPDTLFVVISAHAEFEYARRAMECGAFSYILKPLEESDVLFLADRLAAVLAEKTGRKLLDTVRTLTIHTLFGGDLLNSEDLSLLSRSLPERYRVCICRGISPDFSEKWFRIYDDLAIGILEADRIPGEDQLCGYSKAEDRLEMLSERLREALIAFYTLRFYGKRSGAYLYQDTERHQTDEVQILMDSCAGNNPDNVREELDRVRERAFTQGYSIVHLTVFYNNLLRTLIRRYPDAGLQEELREFDSCFRMYGVMHTADAFFDSVRVLFENCLSGDGEGDDTRNAVLNVVRYVDLHYAEPMTLEQLTGQFNISLSYLCRCFKKETGLSFTAYLKKRRLERACELLKRSDLTVAQIGEQLGFTDYCYFTKVFKKNMGCSPSAYRREMKRE